MQLRHRAGNCSLNQAQSERSFQDDFTNYFSDVTLVNKDGHQVPGFLQGLVSSSQHFSFNLSFGKSHFSFDKKELLGSSWTKKKKSPSQLRREEKRKAAREYLKKTSDATVTVAESLDFTCNDCGQAFKTEKGLNIHVGRLHKDMNFNTPEKELINRNVEEPALTLTTAREERDKEVVNRIHFRCHYCKYPPREFVIEADLSIHYTKRHSFFFLLI